MNKRFCRSLESFIQQVIFPELELIISDDGIIQPIVNFVIVYLKLSFYYKDCFSLNLFTFQSLQ